MDKTPQRPAFPISGFEILSPIGQGAYGDVWLARTSVGGLYRAIKFVYRDRFPTGSRAFETEYNGLVRFLPRADRRGRQLAILHAVMQPAGDVFYYVMELADDAVPRDDLDPTTYQPLTLQTFQGKGVGDVRRCLRLAVDLAEALAELHEVVGVAHRDIKPSNLIIVGGRLKIADIGLVTSAEEVASGRGTPDFRADPEVGNLTKADDIWCVGKVLYFMLFGTVEDFYRLRPEHEPIVSHPLWRDLNHVIDRACQPSPEDRYASAADLASDLKAIDAGVSVHQSQELRRRLAAMRRFASVAATAAVVVAAAFLVYVLAQVENRRQRAEQLEVEARFFGYLRKALYELERGILGVAGNSIKDAQDLNPAMAADSMEYQMVSHAVKSQIPKPKWEFDVPGEEEAVRVVTSQDESAMAAFVREGGIESRTGAGHILVFTNGPWGLSGTISNAHALCGFIPGTRRIVFTGPDDALREVAAEAPNVGFPNAPTKGPGAFLRSRDGGTLLFKAPSRDGAGTDLVLWNTRDAQPVFRWALNMGGSAWDLRAASVSGSGRSVVAACQCRTNDPSYGLFRFEVGEPRPQLVSTNLTQVWAIDFSPDGRRVAIAGHMEAIHVLDAQTWDTVQRIETQQSEVHSLTFLQDSARIVYGDALGSVWICDVETATRRRIGLHAKAVDALGWHANSKQVVSAGRDGKVQLWDPQPTTQSPYVRMDWSAAGGGFLASSNSSFVLVTTSNRSVVRVDLATSQQTMKFEGAFQPLAWKSPERVFLALGPNGDLVRGDVVTGTLERTRLACPSDVAENPSVKVSPSGNLAALTIEHRGGGASMLLWDLRNEEDLLTTPLSNRTGNIAFAHDDSFALVVDREDHPAFIWLDLANLTSSMIDVPTLKHSVTSMTLAPDSSYLVVGLDDGSVAGVPLGPSGGQPNIHPGHGGTVYALTFSKDGRRLFSGSDEGILIVRSMPGFRNPVSFPFFDSPSDARGGDVSVDALKVSMDGRQLHGYTAGGTFRLWKTTE